jgi:hypothetical protein
LLRVACQLSVQCRVASGGIPVQYAVGPGGRSALFTVYSCFGQHASSVYSVELLQAACQLRVQCAVASGGIPALCTVCTVQSLQASRQLCVQCAAASGTRVQSTVASGSMAAVCRVFCCFRRHGAVYNSVQLPQAACQLCIRCFVASGDMPAVYTVYISFRQQARCLELYTADSGIMPDVCTVYSCFRRSASCVYSAQFFQALCQLCMQCTVTSGVCQQWIASSDCKLTMYTVVSSGNVAVYIVATNGMTAVWTTVQRDRQRCTVATDGMPIVRNFNCAHLTRTECQLSVVATDGMPVVHSQHRRNVHGG